MRRITETEAQAIRRFDEIRQKNYFVNASQLQSVYNQVFERNLPTTTCSSCLRKRIQELVDALNRQEEKDKIEAAKVVLSILEEDTSEETETEEIKEEENADKQTTPKAKGRKKKQS